MASKRGNGEGTIYRFRGGWAAAITCGYVDGVRKREVHLGATRAEVADKLREALGAKANGELVLRKQTVDQFFTRWLDELRSKATKPNTLRAFEARYRLDIAPAIGKLRLSELEIEHVDLVARHCRERGLSLGTQGATRTVLRLGLRRALRYGYIRKDLVRLADPIPQSHFKPMFLTREQANELLRAAEGDRFEATYVLGVTCGLREGEILGLRWEDLDLERRRLSVTGTLVIAKGQGLIRVAPKTRTSLRTIDLPAVAVDALRRRRRAQLEERFAGGPAWADTGYVFTTATGNPVTQAILLQRGFVPLLRRVGLPVGSRAKQGFRFHDLRHTCASLLLQAGVPVKVVSEMLGHASIKITLDLYGHVYAEDRARTAQAMDEIVGG